MIVGVVFHTHIKKRDGALVESGMIAHGSPVLIRVKTIVPHQQPHVDLRLHGVYHRQKSRCMRNAANKDFIVVAPCDHVHIQVAFYFLQQSPNLTVIYEIIGAFQAGFFFIERGEDQRIGVRVFF